MWLHQSAFQASIYYKKILINFFQNFSGLVNGDALVQLQMDNVPTTDSRATLFLQNNDDVLRDLSVCLWFKVNYFRDALYLFSYATSHAKNNNLNLNISKSELFNFIVFYSYYKWGQKGKVDICFLHCKTKGFLDVPLLEPLKNFFWYKVLLTFFWTFFI